MLNIKYKIVGYDNDFTLPLNNIKIIPFLEKLITKNKISKDTCLYIEEYEDEGTIINKLDTHILINNYITYWSDKENKNNIKFKKEKLFERSLIIKKLVEYDLKLIYDFVDSNISKVQKNDLEKDLEIIKILNRLIMTVSKMEMVNLENKCLTVLCHYITDMSYGSFMDYLKIKNEL
mgnify:CR=1 FL=1